VGRYSQERIALIANGDLVNPEAIRERIRSFPILVAVDGGLKHCHALGLQPDLIVGDFDSTLPSLLESYSGIARLQVPREKDQTDLEIAIQEVMGAETQEVTVFASLGGRADHTLGNIVLLSRYAGRLFLESDRERLFVIDQTVTLDCAVGQTISLIPLNGPVHGVTTQGLQWELVGCTLDKNFIGISNVATRSQVVIQVADGDLLCCVLF